MHRNLILILCLVMSIISCKKKLKYHYAIHDLPEKFQPFLDAVVNNTHQPKIRDTFNLEELHKLSLCEHPQLRIGGLYELLAKKGADTLGIILSHIDDTAIIAIDKGEFGVENEKIADALIFRARIPFKLDTVLANLIILKHNRLRSAYFIPEEIDPKGLNKSYYSSIKEMTNSEPPSFYNYEYALYALAKYKKNEDIDFIKQKLLDNYWQITIMSFKLMEEYPNPKYIEVFEKYIRYQLKDDLHKNGEGNTAEMITTAASYKSKESAAILEKMHNYIPYFRGYYEDEYWIEQIVIALYQNKCPAYEPLLAKTRKYWIQLDKSNN